MRLTSCIPALGMLTSPLVLLSKPVGPVMRWQILICVIELRPERSRRAYNPRLTLTFYQRTWPALSARQNGGRAGSRSVGVTKNIASQHFGRAFGFIFFYISTSLEITEKGYRLYP